MMRDDATGLRGDLPRPQAGRARVHGLHEPLLPQQGTQEDRGRNDVTREERGRTDVTRWRGHEGTRSGGSHVARGSRRLGATREERRQGRRGSRSISCSGGGASGATKRARGAAWAVAHQGRRRCESRRYRDDATAAARCGVASGPEIRDDSCRRSAPPTRRLPTLLHHHAAASSCFLRQIIFFRKNAS